MSDSKSQIKYIKKDVSVYIDNIRNSFAAGKYAPLITAIEFNNYKNVSNNMKLEFTFPVSLIVGANGTNKTSILRALEGCPKGKSLSSYWFSTDLDPIPKAKDEADYPRYVHYYNFPNNRDFHAQVGKHMTFKGNRDDYFEPERRSSDGLEDKDIPKELLMYRKDGGWKPIPKKVLYIDMRQRVAAYDINMTYGLDKIFFEKKNLKLIEELRLKYGYSKTMSKEDRKLYNDELDKRKFTMKRTVKAASKRMSKVFAGEVEKNRKYWGKKRFSGGRIIFKPEEIEWINYILGREYKSIVALDHSFFKLPGTTVRVEVQNSKVAANSMYSEAYAGSGEYAVIMMVHNIYKAKEGSLILMDEPENSLHPESQRRLLKYILYKTQMCRHQFVISTHSMYMSESLPNEARIALSLNANGFVEPHMNVTHRDAFMGVGAAPQVPVGKVAIKVEDGLAEAMVRHVLLGSDDRSIQDRYIIEAVGSCSYAIGTYIPADIRRNASDTLWILDGDCNYCEKDNIISRLEEKLGPNYGYDYYACRVALYYVVKVQGSSGVNQDSSRVVNGYDAVVAYLDALETKSRDKVNRCLEEVNKKVNNFILSKGDSQKEREERIQSTLSWLEKYVHYLPGDRNPESWVLGQTFGINVDGERAKKWISDHSREIREACKLLSSDKINSNHILQYEVGLLEDIDKSKFESLRTVLEKYDG